MMRVQDVHGAIGDDPIVWEILAERWHASRLEQQRIEVRRSEGERMSDFEAFKAKTIEAFDRWQQGNEPLQVVEADGGPSNAEVSGLDAGAGGDSGRADAGAPASPGRTKRRQRDDAEPGTSGDAGAAAGPEA